MKEEAYRRLTYDLTVSVARTLAKLNLSMICIYVPGQEPIAQSEGGSCAHG